MNTPVLPRPSAPPQPAVPSPPPAPTDPPPLADRRDALLLAPTFFLLAAASLPLGRTFVGWAWARPVLAAVAIALGLSFGVRRLGGGPLVGLATSIAGWAVFVTGAFLGHAAWAGIVPTAGTLDAGVALWARGLELLQEQPAPVLPEPGLLLLAVTGVWAVTHAVDGLVFQLDARLKAVLLAVGLWLVPLVIAPDGSPVPWTVPLLAATALFLFVASATELGDWGAWVGPRHEHRPARVLGALAPWAAVVAATAIVVGVVLGTRLPGYGDPPWYEVSGGGGTTVTTNPIVTIKPSLTARDHGPVMRVRTPRPVYLRTTALDIYSPEGEWTNAGIRGGPISAGRVLPDPHTDGVTGGRLLDVAVEVVDLKGAVLVPAPYRPRAIRGGVGEGFQFDERLATLTTGARATLSAGDAYEVSWQPPVEDPAAVRDALAPASPQDTQLPDEVPAEVAELARSIVTEVGATTPFEQALAIQEEFQSGRWAYSLTPPAGHSPDAMLSFLETRVGYCEQYAGTMAVMLRTLDIPARVAVGFTPGEATDDGTYVVTDANAHAWVEVLFSGHGWVAFEPTPRDDGNVLPPSAEDLAPEQTVAEERGAEPPGPEQPQPDSTTDPSDDAPEPEAPAPGQGPEDPAADADAAVPGARPLWPIALGVALAVALAAASAAMWRRRGQAARSPSERVLAARDGVVRLGRGLGVGPAAWETDHEYLTRLAEQGTGRAPAATLADHVAAARYAPDLPRAAAEEAEAAAAALRSGLLAGRPAPARALVRIRGGTSALLARAATRLPAARRAS